MTTNRPRCVLCATPIDPQWAVDASGESVVEVGVCRACFGRWNDEVQFARAHRNGVVVTRLPTQGRIPARLTSYPDPPAHAAHDHETKRS